MIEQLRVLLVDDNPQDRHLVVRELRKAFPSVTIFEATNQPELDERILLADFEIVITDFHLHWSDGIRVLQAVKQRMPNCPVIMFTGTGCEEVAVEAMKQGLNDYIIKHVKHLVRLQGAVQAALNHATTRQRMDQLASRLESLLSQLHVGVFSCSPEGRFLELNQAMVELLDFDAELDDDRKTLTALFSNDSQASRFLQEVVTSAEPQETEIEVATNPNQRKVYRLNARLVASDGERPRIDGLIEDVTRRKQAEAKSHQARIAAAQIAMLSPREHEVLQQVVEGHANKVTARLLDISEKTVEKHRSSLMKKLGVRSVPDLVRLAILAQASTE
ncbi:MAG: LuxR C-terminal-related transcriptional regulator [Planctomycetota bacterium]